VLAQSVLLVIMKKSLCKTSIAHLPSKKSYWRLLEQKGGIKKTGKKQIYIDEPASGMASLTYWKTIK